MEKSMELIWKKGFANHGILNVPKISRFFKNQIGLFY